MAQAIFNDVFGRLEWDGQLDCWLGGIDWPPGLHTEVAIWQPGQDVAAGLRMARDGLDWLQCCEEQARRQVAEALIEDYNDAWSQEPEPTTEDEFMGRIELVRIGFVEDGSLLLSYDAGEMFGGHMIDAEFAADRSFRGTGLVG
jgi:hypothetical protein